MHHPHRTSENPSRPRNRALLAILLTAQLMVILDITAVNIAMPSIAHDLHIGAPASAGRSPATRWSSAACCSSAVAPRTCSGAAGYS